MGCAVNIPDCQVFVVLAERHRVNGDAAGHCRDSRVVGHRPDIGGTASGRRSEVPTVGVKRDRSNGATGWMRKDQVLGATPLRRRARVCEGNP